MKQNFFTTLALTLFFFSGLQAQTISLDPDAGFQDETLVVGISGVGTQFQSGTTTCGTLDGNAILMQQAGESIDIQDVYVVNDEFIAVEFTIPSNAIAGNYDVSIWENASAGCEVSCDDCFEVLTPGDITNLDITTAGQGEELKVTISGENTYWSQASPCSIDAGNVIFSQGTSTIFTPDSVVVVSSETLCAFMTVPDSIEIGFFDLVVGAGQPCETNCEDCFEVMFGPEIVFLSGNQGGQGESPIFTMGANFGSFSNCEFTTDNVFLQLGNEIIYPTSVEIVDDELVASFDIPENAAVGDYDLIIGEGLDYDCVFSCEGCYEVTTPPDIVLPTNTDGEQGTEATLSVGITSGTYDDCELTTENVYLVLGNEVIYPTSVEIVGDELVTTFDIPLDATVGDYDLIIGEGLGYGCTFECVACYSISESTGIDPIFNAALSVYPNPVDEQLHFNAEMLLHDVSLQIYDTVGQLVYDRRWSHLQREVINVADLPKGVYTIKILASEGEAYKRVVRQ